MPSIVKYKFLCSNCDFLFANQVLAIKHFAQQLNILKPGLEYIFVSKPREQFSMSEAVAVLMFSPQLSSPWFIACAKRLKCFAGL